MFFTSFLQMEWKTYLECFKPVILCSFSQCICNMHAWIFNGTERKKVFFSKSIKYLYINLKVYFVNIKKTSSVAKLRNKLFCVITINSNYSWKSKELRRSATVKIKKNRNILKYGAGIFILGAWFFGIRLYVTLTSTIVFIQNPAHSQH